MLQWLYTHVSSICFICFECMLQMFHLDAVQVDLVLHMLLWLYTYFKCFVYFRHILQVFHLDVSKVDPRRAHVAMAVMAGG
jgi:hypothetical protein